VVVDVDIVVCAHWIFFLSVKVKGKRRRKVISTERQCD
jgi:hypothetical protein